MKVQAQRISLAAIGFALFLLTIPLQAYQTQNVFVVVIDGLRDLEGFEDPTHQYIPRIWNDLRPQGTIYTNFYNDGATYTTPGHLTILSGQWQTLPNLARSGFNDVRCDTPTIFEYYRYYTGAPQSACWVVTGKQNNLHADWALEPTFGPEYKANLLLGGTDSETFNTLTSVLAQDHPSLVLVNFQDVDLTGHSGDWASYTNAIQMVDNLVYSIWTQLIQGDAVYKDRTTMIVTSDHGRHLPGFGDFQDHGGVCQGCRHIIFLAVGPDTPQGSEVTERRYLIDIAPTVGELLGFPTPFARGQTLTGVFKAGLAPNPRLHVYQQNPGITIFNQTAFVVWSENDSTNTGTQRIYLKKKLFTETSFSTPILINDATVSRSAFFPSVAADQNGLHVVWLDGRALDARGDTWSVFYRRSPDYGTTWEPERLIVTSTFESDGGGAFEIPAEPEIFANNLSEIIFTARRQLGANNALVSQFTSFRSLDGGKTWGEVPIDQTTASPCQYAATTLSAPWEIGLTRIYLAQTPNQPDGNNNWEIGFKRSLNNGTMWQSLQRLTNEAGYSYMPALVYGGKLLTVWANRDISGTPWQLLVRVSGDKGLTWGSPVTIPTGTASAWQPTLVWDAFKKQFCLVWTDYNASVPNLRFSTSTDGTNWTLPVGISANSNGGTQRKPLMAYGGGRKYLVWEEQDVATGDWSIQAIELNGNNNNSGAAPAIQTALDTDSPGFQLLSNYPNPFNPETWMPYTLGKTEDVVIKIYSAEGQLVRTLDLGHKPAGVYTGRDQAGYWDGANQNGERVSSGVYYYRMEAGTFKQVRKMVILK